jgi:DNA-binding transcriptional regulator YdaS (Cro superfamily)
MVQAMIKIPKEVNQILNIVKAKYNLKDKSEAIARVVAEYGIEMLGPELRPEYVKKLKKLEKEQGISFKNISELRKIIEG